MKKILIILLILFSFFSIVVSAESGTINISDDKITDYVLPNVCFGTVGFNPHLIYLDTANYNYINYFDVFPIAVSYAKDFGGSFFSFTGGATGGQGYVSYDKNLNRIRYVFPVNMVVTSSPITISLTNDFFGELSKADYYVKIQTPDITAPIGIYAADANCLGGKLPGTYHSEIALRAQDTYTVDYIFNDQFVVNVFKNPYINSLYWINGTSGSYTHQTGYTKDNVINSTHVYNDGIILNATLASGMYTTVWVNTTILGAPPPIVIDPTTGVGIQFNNASYVIGETANISWIRTSPTPFLYTDFVALDDPTGTTTYLVTSPPGSGYTKTSLNIAGTYTVRFARCLIVCSTLNSDTASVVNEMASYILVNASVPVGQYVSGTYLRGWNNTGGRIVVFKDVSGDLEEIDSLPLDIICCTEKTVSQLFFPSPGNYRVVLMKGYSETKATALTIAYYTEIVPQLNITVSNISLNKIYYTFGEFYTLRHQTDSFNFSNKAIRIEVYDPVTGSSVKISDIAGQNGIYSGEFNGEEIPFSGSLAFRLMGINATGDYVLANTTFILSAVDTEGYGLSLSKNEVCAGEQTSFIYYAPSSAYLSIVDKSYTWKEYNLNSSTTGKTISLTISLPGSYELMLRSNKTGDVKFTQILKVNSCELAPTITEESPFSALWGSTVFWAVMVLFLFAGVGFYYAGVGGGVVGGGLGVISGALLGWIPLWAVFLFAAVSFIGAAIVITSGIKK